MRRDPLRIRLIGVIADLMKIIVGSSLLSNNKNLKFFVKAVSSILNSFSNNDFSVQTKSCLIIVRHPRT